MSWENRSLTRFLVIQRKCETILGCDQTSFSVADAAIGTREKNERRLDVRQRLHPADFLHMQKRRLEIVRASASSLKPDGIFVY